jgi:hypothetical protein
MKKGWAGILYQPMVQDFESIVMQKQPDVNRKEGCATTELPNVNATEEKQPQRRERTKSAANGSE